jgi:hypothetical protein
VVMKIKEVKPRDPDEPAPARRGAREVLAAVLVPVVLALGAGFLAGVAAAAAYVTFKILTSF